MMLVEEWQNGIMNSFPECPGLPFLERKKTPSMCTIFFLWIAVSHIKELVEDSKRTDLTPEGRLAAIISGVLHIVMGVSMAFMNVIMFILV
jgi:hypothetical protein